MRHVDDGPDARPSDSRRFEEIGVAGWKAAYDGRFARMPQPLQVLWTLEGDLPARRFYERHGFATAGARRLRALGSGAGDPLPALPPTVIAWPTSVSGPRVPRTPSGSRGYSC